MQTMLDRKFSPQSERSLRGASCWGDVSFTRRSPIVLGSMFGTAKASNQRAQYSVRTAMHLFFERDSIKEPTASTAQISPGPATGIGNTGTACRCLGFVFIELDSQLST